MIELFECERLSARLSRSSCEINRKSGRLFNCVDCSGLGAAVVEQALDIQHDGFVLEFEGENLAVIKAFSALSKASGGVIVDDLCTIIDLYLDGQLMFRKDSY